MQIGTLQETSWPPRSPGEVLLFSPSRRKDTAPSRARDISPSPIKQKLPASLFGDVRRLDDHNAGPSIKEERDDMEGEEEDDDEESDDEETLRLKLEAIEARLKLKKLAKARKSAHREAAGPPFNTGDTEPETTLKTAPRRPRTPPPHGTVQVPPSPRQTIVPVLPDSPSRVQLGIDKGLKAADVSLTKARSQRATAARSSADKTVNPFQGAGPSNSRTSTYSERIAAQRTQDIKREQFSERVRAGRGSGFNISDKTAQRPAEPRSEQSRVGERASSTPLNSGEETSSTRIDAHIPRTKRTESRTRAHHDVDTFTGFTLSKRNMQEEKLSQAFEDKVLVSIPRMLKDVHGPDYDPPELEKDFVVFGIIASKSSPSDHDTKHKTTTNHHAPDPDENARSKYMVMRLTDLEWEVNLFLFDTGFEAFWKLSVGTVVALLNPAIMPPRPHLRDTGAFSLKISSSEDTVLQIGTAKDIGFCKSVKKDGQMCNQWIDARKTEFCEFHISLRTEKTKAGRMEINGMAGLDMFRKKGKFAKNKRGGGGGGGSIGGKFSRRVDQADYGNGPRYDRTSGETAYIIPRSTRGTTAAALLDAEDLVNGGLSAAERSRIRLAAQERERNLASQLGSKGDGLGSRYMRVRNGEAGREAQSAAAIARNEVVEVATLALLDTKAADVRLSPSKGSRKVSTQGRSDPVGWSGAYKRGLPSPDRQARLDFEPSKRPKTSTAAVRERVVGTGNDFNDDDDDDDLDIV